MPQPPRTIPLLHQMDACRPDSDDLSDPALAELRAELEIDEALARHFSRLQAADRRLSEALSDVPAPDGLETRLLTALASAERGVAGQLSPESAATVRRPEPSRLQHRRWWAAAACTAAAVLLLTALLPLWNVGTTVYLPGEVPEAAIRYHRQFDATQPLHPPREAPPLAHSDQIDQRLTLGWQSAQSLLGARTPGVAFQLRSATGQQATLYTVRGQVQGLPAGIVPHDAVQTAGMWASAWQTPHQVFVLVIPTQDRNAYRQFLPAAGGLASSQRNGPPVRF